MLNRSSLAPAVLNRMSPDEVAERDEAFAESDAAAQRLFDARMAQLAAGTFDRSSGDYSDIEYFVCMAIDHNVLRALAEAQRSKDADERALKCSLVCSLLLSAMTGTLGEQCDAAVEGGVR